MDREIEDILEKLKEEHPIDELVKFTDIDITEKLQENPFFIVKYRELFLREQSYLIELEEKLEKLIGKRYDWYRFESDRELTKTEIEKYYLPQDKKINIMKKILRKQKARVQFFDICVKGFEQMGWRMKCMIDAMRIGI